VQVIPCTNFTVNVRIRDVVDLYAWQFNMTFDPNLMQCVSVMEGEFLRNVGSTTGLILSVNNTNGWIKAACSLVGAVSGASGGCVLAYVTFHCASVGGSALDLHDTKLLNSSRVSVPAPPNLGDINGDGKVDLKDVYIVAKAYCSKVGDPRYDPQADLNSDGAVDIEDLIIVVLNFGHMYPPSNALQPQNNIIAHTVEDGYVTQSLSVDLGVETFPPGTYKATILWENTSAWDKNPFGWYTPVGTVSFNGQWGKAPGINNMVELFSGPATVGSTVQFTVDTYFGFWLNNTMPDPDIGGLFYTENKIQPDDETRAQNTPGFDHAHVEYVSAKPSEGYLISFEDAWQGTGGYSGLIDYDDMVVKLVPTSYWYKVKFEHGYEREIVGPDCNACTTLPNIPIETLVETHINVLNPNEYPVNVTKKFVKILPQRGDVLIIDPTYKRAYFGLYKAEFMQPPVNYPTYWSLLKRTIEWATGGKAPANTRIVLFTYCGVPFCTAHGFCRDSTAVHNQLIPWGYNPTNIVVHHQHDIEVLPPSYYGSFDLVIYWNGYGYCPKNVIESGVPFITVTYMHTDEMGIGTGALTTHELGNTFYVVNNHHYPTGIYSIGQLTLEGNIWFDATTATGGIPLVICPGPQYEPHDGHTEKVPVTIPPNKGFEIDAADIKSWPPASDNPISWPPYEYCETYWKGFVVIESPSQIVVNNKTVPLLPLEVVAVYNKKTVDIINKITFHLRLLASPIDTLMGRLMFDEPYELSVPLPYEPSNMTLEDVVKRELGLLPPPPPEPEDIDIEIVETTTYFDFLECVTKERIVFTLHPTNLMMKRFLNAIWIVPPGFVWPHWFNQCITLEKVVKVPRIDEIMVPEEIVKQEIIRELLQSGVPADIVHTIMEHIVITIYEVDVAEGVGTGMDVEYIEPEIIDP